MDGPVSTSRLPSRRLLRITMHACASAALLLALWTVPEEVRTGQTQSQLRVSATVLHSASVRILSQPQQLEITEQDLRRGFIDVPASTVLMIRCNLPDGLALQLSFDPRIVSAATVSGPPQLTQPEDAGGMLRMAGTHLQETRVELHWHLKLSAQARAGTHPWPVGLQMEPF